jgi:hypothetical protein
MSSSSTTTGWVSGNCVDGEGEYDYGGGSTYSGQWRDAKREGEGRYFFPNGGRYEGQFRAGVFHGAGCYTFPNKNSYNGQFVDDAREGRGTYLFAGDGVFWEGTWRAMHPVAPDEEDEEDEIVACAMSEPELKQFLDAQGVDHSTCHEKSELVALAVEQRDYHCTNLGLAGVDAMLTGAPQPSPTAAAAALARGSGKEAGKGGTWHFPNGLELRGAGPSAADRTAGTAPAVWHASAKAAVAAAVREADEEVAAAAAAAERTKNLMYLAAALLALVAVLLKVWGSGSPALQA